MFENIINNFRNSLINDDFKNFRYRHIACLVNGQRLVSYSTNDYNRQYVNRKKTTSLHAEQGCVKNHKRIKGFKLVVFRFDKTGNLCNSSPCSACKKALLGKGIRFIFCSNKDGVIEKLKLDNIEPYFSVSQLRFIKITYNSVPILPEDKLKLL